MKLEKALRERSGGVCEVSGAAENLVIFPVPPHNDERPEHHVLIDAKLREQLESPDQINPNDWRCLNESMWSEVDAVKVIAWRVLHNLRHEGWPADLLDMIYLDEEVLAWAKTGQADEDTVVHKDSNGHILSAGDTVVLIKDLKVKGANFTAKRGTAVRRISLVHDHPGQIEGRVAGQHIVILTEFVKKSK